MNSSATPSAGNPELPYTCFIAGHRDEAGAPILHLALQLEPGSDFTGTAEIHQGTDPARAVFDVPFVQGELRAPEPGGAARIVAFAGEGHYPKAPALGVRTFTGELRLDATGRGTADFRWGQSRAFGVPVARVT